MLILKVDRDSETPIFKQISQGVVALVDAGSLAPGDRLPATRVLARSLGVHRSTVLRAYDELWALGYLESRPGSYSTVRRRARPLSRAERPAEGLINWEATPTPAARAAREDALTLGQDRVPPSNRTVVDFSRLAPDKSLAPSDDLGRCLKSVLTDAGGDLLDYGDPAGYRPLREALARRMRTHSISVSTDEVVITSGAQQALDLVLRLLTRPGDRIAIEAPTYSVALSLFRFHGLEVQSYPMRPDGMDLDELRRGLARQPPALLYTIPSFHNPTGVTTGQAHRERLLELCESRRIPLVEDGFEEEMKYFGQAVLPIKSMDQKGIVLYIGTFSKVVFPGLRVGWIAAPRACAQQLLAAQHLSSLAGNTLAQAAVHRFCTQGLYEAHLRRVHKVYRKRMQAVLQALRERMPRSVSWTEPAGGYTLWVRVPKSPVDEPTLHERLLRDGVKLAPGRQFFAAAPKEPQFRLSVSSVTEAEIREGCRRLGDSLASVLGT